eukprot:3024940-Ditylum_brightwellii.AAC.1
MDLPNGAEVACDRVLFNRTAVHHQHARPHTFGEELHDGDEIYHGADVCGVTQPEAEDGPLAPRGARDMGAGGGDAVAHTLLAKMP